MIKVLVVEDSPVVREFLVQVLRADPGIQVVGTAASGEEALITAQRTKPSVITMDINMPQMDGFEATRRIMETVPVPIIIVSGHYDTKEVATTFRALEAGALAVLPRPMGLGHPEHAESARHLREMVKLMSEVKVVRRWPRTARLLAGGAAAPPVADAAPGIKAEPAILPRPLVESIASLIRSRSGAGVALVAIGASTGGPLVLQTILGTLPKGFPTPVLIVQHMTSGFYEGFVDWLAQSTGQPVHLARHGERPLPAHFYVAPDRFQMQVESDGRLALTQAAPEMGMCPSVSHLFRSVASVYGSFAAGVLLTGMGKDGAAELKLMRDRGAVTLAQDEASSAVHGMPGEAIKLNAAMQVLPPTAIARALAALAGRDLFLKAKEKDHSLGREQPPEPFTTR